MIIIINIKDFGWDEYFERDFMENPLTHANVARVIADYGLMLRVITDTGELVINRPIKKYNSELIQIAVGDWILFEPADANKAACILRVLKRKTKFSRAAAGSEIREQIVAANVDTVFLIQSLNKDFNMRRLERYLIAAWESGAIPVVVLTKSDCCNDVAGKISIVQNTAPGVEVIAISCITGEGLENIQKHIIPGKTVALLGSSGVGKSTLANYLAGEDIFKTQTIRENDSKGKHTTTHRELIILPSGGLILDTPGMRSLSLWESENGMDVIFGDIEELVKLCRFNDCLHQSEPGCAVREAIINGELDSKRWQSWQKLQKEQVRVDAKRAGKIMLIDKQNSKSLSKLHKQFYKENVNDE